MLHDPWPALSSLTHPLQSSENISTCLVSQTLELARQLLDTYL